MIIDRILVALCLLPLFFLLFFIGKIVHDKLHPEYDVKFELTERDNPALSLALAGYYLGLVFAIGGALVGPTVTLVDDILDLLIYGTEAILLLNLGWVFCDKCILTRFSLTDELIRDQNVGAGAVCFGMMAASGLLVFGAISGDDGTVWTALLFWGVGLGVLWIATRIYARLLSYDIHKEIEKDNVAAGVAFAGVLLSIGVVVGLAAEVEVPSLAEGLVDYLLIAGAGIALLAPIRFLADRILLPGAALSDEIARQEKPNLGAAFIESASYLASAVVLFLLI